ncbi:unnamed protein product [Brugia timori]|uniref:Transposase n=1 Tax=Brugia timori TaxID=42155 RepID=A0A0R3QZN7_9BILA|nr:unnamed protein product [Brugia timori]
MIVDSVNINNIKYKKIHSIDTNQCDSCRRYVIFNTIAFRHDGALEEISQKSTLIKNYVKLDETI